MLILKTVTGRAKENQTKRRPQTGLWDSLGLEGLHVTVVTGAHRDAADDSGASGTSATDDTSTASTVVTAVQLQPWLPSVIYGVSIF